MALRTAGFILPWCLWVSVAGAQRSDNGEPARVVVAAVVERPIVAAHGYVGTVAPLRRSIVGSAVAGRVVEFSAEAGQRVAAGAPLAQLRTGTLEIQLKAAQAEVRLRAAELAELENGALQEEVDQSAARLNAADVAMKIAGRKLDRVLRLEAQNAVSSDDVETARADADQAAQVYLEAKAHHQLVSMGPRPERIAQATARMDAQLEQVRVIEDQIDRHTVVAPFDGYVIRELTEVGQWVDQGSPVAEIVHLDQVEVQVHVLASQVIDLDRSSPVAVKVSDVEGPFDGQITGIVPQADETSRAVPVLIAVKNRDGGGGEPVLKAGMLVRLELRIRQRDGVLLVPKDALVLKEGSTAVFVVDGGRAREVAVETRVAQDDLIEVRGNLKPGDLVVVEGNERLKSGQNVEITKRVADAGEARAARRPPSRARAD